MPLRLQAAGLTDRGRRRDVNEDSVYQTVIEKPSGDAMALLIVADGIGGRLAGEVASYWAVETIKNSLADVFGLTDPRETAEFSTEAINDALAAQNDPRETARLKRDQILDAQNVDWTEQTYFANRIRAAINRANAVVRDYASQKLEGAAEIGTTISVAVVFGTEGLVANVGDSRTYLLREGQLRQVTRDHSYVQRLIDSDYIKEEERHVHPHRHLIYRSLGTKEQVETDIFPIALLPGDFLLLCTDGLWEMIHRPADIVGIIQQAPTVDKACKELVAAANAAGGQDTIGVVLAQVLG